jgi:hypothetical protein
MLPPERIRMKESFMSQGNADFFVDGKKIDNHQTPLTGAQIKSKVPGLDPAYALMLEGHGSDPDKQISDGESVNLDHSHGGPKHFYTVPPATFG